ncbi:hypothetical protein [Burkholderia pseudomallei]|uniref:hypothetical protein n=1 Tax=Burkholderia pseudomallei TaxID=28450 RepID=UPI000A469A81|nr:hypothetical protein [Burkholderia pseudomallei]
MQQIKSFDKNRDDAARFRMIFCRESKFIHYLEYLFQNPFIAIATWTRTHRYGAFDRLPGGMHAAERRMRMSAPVRRAPGDREARTLPDKIGVRQRKRIRPIDGAAKIQPRRRGASGTNALPFPELNYSDD